MACIMTMPPLREVGSKAKNAPQEHSPPSNSNKKSSKECGGSITWPQKGQIGGWVFRSNILIEISFDIIVIFHNQIRQITSGKICRGLKRSDPVVSDNGSFYI
jgi:hypothetical protein